MRMILMVVGLFISEITNAGLYDDLRELRGTISETSRTAKEANELSKTITPEKNLMRKFQHNHQRLNQAM
ncbi:MAG: hypothetical protein Q8L73_06630 [Methylotenera sp.]|nr:hypothetical protein [Methylotenera sp.]